MRLIMEGWTCQNYAFNSGYALNDDTRLTTGFYGIVPVMYDVIVIRTCVGLLVQWI